jgi:hypothetical protein
LEIAARHVLRGLPEGPTFLLAIRVATLKIDSRYYSIGVNTWQFRAIRVVLSSCMKYLCRRHHIQPTKNPTSEPWLPASQPSLKSRELNHVQCLSIIEDDDWVKPR